MLGAGLILTGLLYGTYNRAKELAEIFSHMSISPASLPKNFKLKLTRIDFTIDIKLVNPTADDFAVSGYVATLKRVLVYYRGQLIGMANVNIDEISVPRQDTMILHDVPITLSTLDLAQNITALLPQLQNLSTSTLNDLSFTGVIEAMGREYEIG